MASRMSSSPSWRSSHSTSGRGVMTARTERSPRRITREIIERSSGSTRPVRSASSIIVRISSSVTPDSRCRDWPSRPSPMRADQASRPTTGLATMARICMGRATITATRSALRRPTCLGTSSPSTTEK